jgi:hypothetical protein
MSLRNEQSEFVRCVGKLIAFAYANGYELTFGDTYPFRKHRKGSYHNRGLAIDLNLFKNGVYLTRTEDHIVLGEYWKSLHPRCCWGGKWNDGNHYSWGECWT